MMWQKLIWFLSFFSLLASAHPFSLHCLARGDENGHAKDAVDIAAYREFAMKTTGDPVHGKKIFAGEKIICSKCHAIGDAERLIGPNLLGIADKYSREQLIQAVLEPNAYILSGYATTVLATKSGKILTGIVAERDADTLQLVDNRGTIMSVATAEIEEETAGKTSLMPAGIQTPLSPQQFTDLIAFLQSLRQSTVDRKDNLANPDEISRIKNPIQIHPFVQQVNHPTWFAGVPGRNDQFVVVEQQTAKIWLLKKENDVIHKSLFVDLRPEMDHLGSNPDLGLMSMAFHPRFPENQKYYLMHHVRENNIFSSVVVERQAAEDLQTDADVPTRRLLQMDQTTELHYGCHLTFGPDGYLYIGIGDGGPQEDPEGHAQDLHSFNGKILRIDVDGRQGELPYAIPRSNPFQDDPDEQVKREIWAAGLRMPWRFSFDPPSDDLWVGDVGQISYEEITIVRGGENHGWNVYEGFQPFTDRYKKREKTCMCRQYLRWLENMVYRSLADTSTGAEKVLPITGSISLATTNQKKSGG